MDEEEKNVNPDQWDPERPGGEAIKATGKATDFIQNRAGRTDNVKNKAGNLVGKAAGEAAGDAVAAGTGGIGAIARPIVKKITERLTREAIKNAARAAWAALTPYAGIIIAVLAIVVLIGFAIYAVISIRAEKGAFGKGAGDPAHAYDANDAANISAVLDTGKCIASSTTAQVIQVPYLPQKACPEGGSWCTRSAVLEVAEYVNNKYGGKRLVADWNSMSSVCSGLRAVNTGGSVSDYGIRAIGHGYVTSKATGDQLISQINQSLSKGYPVVYYGDVVFSVTHRQHAFVLIGYDPANKVYIANNTYRSHLDPAAKSTPSINGVCLFTVNIRNHPQLPGSFHILYHP